VATIRAMSVRIISIAATYKYDALGVLISEKFYYFIFKMGKKCEEPFVATTFIICYFS